MGADMLNEEVVRRRVDIAIVAGSLFGIQIAIVAGSLFDLCVPLIYADTRQ